MANDILITPGLARIDFDGSSAGTLHLYVEADGTVKFRLNSDNSDVFVINADGTIEAAAGRVLTIADEGSGNGLDADTVDGIHLAGLVQIARSISTGAGISGGGDLSADRTLSVDIGSQSSGTTIEGSDLLIFEDVTDDGIHSRTFTNLISDLSIVTDSRVIAAGVGLTGGGSLESDRTIDLDISSLSSSTAIASADLLVFEDVTDGGHHSRTLANVISDLNILTTANEGSGSGMDADTVDSLHASQFLRSDVADTASAKITLAEDQGLLFDTTETDNPGWSVYSNSTGNLLFSLAGSFGTEVEMKSGDPNDYTTATLEVAGNRVLTVADEGSGNSLDADTVDSLHASQFLRSDQADSSSGTITVSQNAAVMFHGDRTSAGTNSVIQLSTDTEDVYIGIMGDGSIGLSSAGPDIQAYGNRVLTVADEGSGSGLDADTVDTLQATSFLRSDADDTATGIITFSDQTLFSNGDASNPGIAFSTDDSKGLRFDGSAIISTTSIIATGSSGGMIRNTSAGTSDPGLVPRSGDSNTGISGDGSDNLFLVAGGNEVLQASTEPSAVNYLTVNASAAGNAPTISVAGSDTNIGLIIDSVGTMPVAIRTDGVDKLKVWPGAVQSYAQLISISGSAAAPAYSFSSDGNTGVYSGGGDTIGFAAGGVASFFMNTSHLFANHANGPILANAAGSLTTPNIVANRSDTNTGLASLATDTLSMVTGGTESVRFNTEALAVNYLELQGSATGNAVQIESAGSDIDIDVRIRTKGDGSIVSMIDSSSKFITSSGSNRSLVPVYAPDGTNTAPSYTFTNDTNTGIYSYADNVIGFSTASGVRAVLDVTGLIIGGASGATTRTDSEILSVKGDGGLKLRSADDVDILEAVFNTDWFFGTDTDTDLVLRRNNANSLTLGNGFVTSHGPIRFASLGSTSAPVISFSSDTDTGLYSAASGQLNVTADNTQVFLFHNSVNRGLVKFQSVDGSTSAPAYGFTSDPDTGMYSAGTNAIGFSTNGASRMIIDGGGLYAADAGGGMVRSTTPSGTNPSLVPSSTDTNTGIGHAGADQLALIAGGVLGLQVNNGEVIIPGNLTVNGTTVTVNSNTVAIGDNIIVLNVDEAGTPSQDAGIEIERGTSANVSFLWDEGNDRWSTEGEDISVADVITSGTVDGRDIAADGTKLDGIETGATADQSAAEILSALLTVDGSGTSLDADLLDGQHGSHYLDLTNATGTLADARLSGTYTVTNMTASNDLTSTLDTNIGQDLRLNRSGTAPALIVQNHDYIRLVMSGGSNTGTIGVNSSDELFIDNTSNKIWHAGNDGASSGLDADLLDGQHGSHYLDLANATGTLDIARVADGSVTLAKIEDLTADRMLGRLSTGGIPQELTASQVRGFLGVESGATADQSASEILAALITVDGAGSSLDADTVDGVQLSGLVQTSRSVSTGNGIAGGGDLSTNRTLALDFSPLAATTAMESSDLIVFEDVTDGGIHARTIANVLSDLNVLTTANEGPGNGLDADTVDGVQLSGLVQTSRSVSTGNGIAGGGDLSTNRTLALDFSPLAATTAIVGSDLLVFEDTTDGGIHGRTFTNLISDLTLVQEAITITAGSGLSGGGDLSTSRTIDLDISELAADTAAVGSDLIVFEDVTDGGHHSRTLDNVIADINIVVHDSNGDIDVDRNIHVNGTNEAHFGGTDAASADSKFKIHYNSSADSLDFSYVA